MLKKPEMISLKSSLIISVYKDVAALRVILAAVELQTASHFEVIVSEDGESVEMRALLAGYRSERFGIKHLTHQDCGFRKTTALNRAVLAAESDHLIFIDGDCVPHPRFIESHQRCFEPDRVCSARRVELGTKLSNQLLSDALFISKLLSQWSTPRIVLAITLDSGKNPEAGIYSEFIQRIVGFGELAIVGCNFSCSKKALLAVNGFNQDFVNPGVGEDSDIEWRLREAGYQTKNIKFLAPLFHLYHDRSDLQNAENYRILKETKDANQWRCRSGIRSL